MNADWRAANDESTDAALHYLTQMTGTVVDACQPQAPEFLAQAQRMATTAREPRVKADPANG